jgi:hypothetical protein
VLVGLHKDFDCQVLQLILLASQKTSIDFVCISKKNAYSHRVENACFCEAIHVKVKYSFATYEGRSHARKKHRTRSYEDEQCVKRNVTEVVGEEIILLDKKEA